jgi:hypothetical protein
LEDHDERIRHLVLGQRARCDLPGVLLRAQQRHEAVVDRLAGIHLGLPAHDRSLVQLGQK